MRGTWMAAAVITAALTGTAQVADARIQDEDQQLTRMAAVAESASQHKRVGELYLARAQRLEREATRLERTSRPAGATPMTVSLVGTLATSAERTA